MASKKATKKSVKTGAKRAPRRKAQPTPAGKGHPHPAHPGQEAPEAHSPLAGKAIGLEAEAAAEPPQAGWMEPLGAEPVPASHEPAAEAPEEAPNAEDPEAEEPVSIPDGDWVEKLERARRRPVQISDEAPQEAPEPAFTVEAPEPPVHDELPPADAPARPAPQSPDGLSLTEQYLLFALSEGWDDRMEKYRAGAHGPALVGSLLLDLALRGKVRLQRDRFQVLGGTTGDGDLDRVLDRLRELQDAPSADAMRRLGSGNVTQAVRPWKQRLARRGLAQERTWRHLGLFRRSATDLLDPDAQAKLENRLVRLLSGGTPDAQSVCLLGLIDAAGLLPGLVPSSALDFNRKRIQGLVLGRDTLGYLADRDFKGMQEVLVTTVLRNVKQAQQGR